MTNQELIDSINIALDAASEDELFDIWNEYCICSYNSDSMIYRNSATFFEDRYAASDMWIFVKHIIQGDYASSDRFVKYSLCTGNLVSFDYIMDDKSPYDQSELISWLIRNHGDDLEYISRFIKFDITSNGD
jgi:hypothetical protein